jgi:hypothetical protein
MPDYDYIPVKVEIEPGPWPAVLASALEKEAVDTILAGVRAGIISPSEANRRLCDPLGEKDTITMAASMANLYSSAATATTIPSASGVQYIKAPAFEPATLTKPEPFKLSPKVAFVDDARIERTIKDGKRVFRGRFSTLFVMCGCNDSPSERDLKRFVGQLTRGYHAIRPPKKSIHMWRRVVVNEKARRQVVELGVTEIGVGSARWIDIVQNLRK